MTFFERMTQGVLPEVMAHWDEAMISLMFRFIAVFLVLFMIQLAMQLSGRLIRLTDRTDGAAESDKPDAAVLDPHGPDGATLAAIGLALELDSQPEAVRIPDDRGASAWVIAGRSRQLRPR